ncbi:MAG: hypothetical protein WB763_10780 [Terriglobia bacterium]
MLFGLLASNDHIPNRFHWTGILQLIQGLRGDLHVTFEEGTWAGWLAV